MSRRDRFVRTLGALLVTAFLAWRIGIVIGKGSYSLVVLVPAALALAWLALQSSVELVFYLWFAMSPLLQTWPGFVLGRGIPDLTWDRILILLLVLRLWGQRGSDSKRIDRGTKPGIDWLWLAIVLFAAYYVLLIVIHGDRMLSYGQLFVQQFILPVLVFWSIRHLDMSERKLRVFNWLVVVIALYLFAGVVVEQLTAKVIAGSGRTVLYGSLVRSHSFVGYYGALGPTAGILLVYLLTWLGVEDWRNRAWPRLLVILAAGGAALCVFLSILRSSWIATMGAMLVLATTIPRLRRRLFISGVLAVGLMSLLIADQYIPPQFLGKALDARTYYERLVLQTVQTESILTSPVVGHGPGQALRMHVPEISSFGLSSHNGYLTLWMETGMIGLVLYSLPTGLLLLRSLRVAGQLPERGWNGRQALGGLWATQVVFLITFAAIDLRWFTFVNCLYWLNLGLIAGIVGYSGRNST